MHDPHDSPTLPHVDSSPSEAPTIAPPTRGDTEPNSTTNAPNVLPNIPGFHIESELGRGGMGVVYLARQIRLNRPVALKMIISGEHASADTRLRFLAEAEAIAKLHHPGIVQVHEFGTHDNNPFFALEYVPGGSLDKKLAGTPLPPKEAAALVEKLAHAVQAAHDQGIIHRDLKPANILLDSPLSTQDSALRTNRSALRTLSPKITDFGLVKKAGSDMTATGQILGTPSYMAPEQADGKKSVGPAVDIYALGAILYECLTGRPPFKAATPLDTILQVVNDEPVSIRQLQAKTPMDLETICHKCLQKDAGKRYASAAALAEDLVRYLRGETIAARPVGKREKVWRWCRRYPAVVGLMAALLIGAVTSMLLAWWAYTEKDRADGIAGGYKYERNRADDKTKEVEKERNIAQRLLATQANTEGFRLLNEGDYFTGILWLTEPLLRAQNQPEISHTTRLRLGTYRTFANPGIVLQSIFGHERAVSMAGFCSNGNHIFSIDRFSHLLIWDLANAKSVKVSEKIGSGLHCFFNRSMTKFAWRNNRVGANTIQVLDVYNGTPLTDPIQHSARILNAAFSPDDRYLITTSIDKLVRIWSLGKETKLLLQYPHSAEIRRIVFSQDSHLLATVSEQGSVQLWDLIQGKQKLLASKQVLAGDAAFSPDARYLSLATYDRVTRSWDVACYDMTSDQLAIPKFATNRYGIAGIVYSPDGMRILTTSTDSQARIWDASNGRLITEISSRNISTKYSADDMSTTECFSPDGRWVITSCSDNTVRIWDGVTGKLVNAPLKHNGRINHVGFDHNGSRFITASEDASVHVWHLMKNDHSGLELKHANDVRYASFSPDGKTVLTASADKTAQLWEASTGKKHNQSLQHESEVNYAAYSPDGKKIVTVCKDSSARIWDAESCKPITRPLFHDPTANRFSWPYASFSLDGQKIVTSSNFSNAVIWDTSSGQVVTKTISPEKPAIRTDRYAPVASKPFYPREEEERRISNIALFSDQTDVQFAEFSPDGNMIVTASRNKHARVWDAHTGKPMSPPLMHEYSADQAHFSPDNRFVVTAERKNAQVWDAKSGQHVAPVLIHDGDISQLCFSSDSNCIATVSGVFVRIWDVKTGKPITAPMRHFDSVRNASFSCDGKYVATSSADGAARVWESSTGQPVTPRLLHSGPVNYVTYHPMLNQILTASWDRTARIWELPIEERVEKDIIQIARIYATSKIDETGNLQSLSLKTELLPWFNELKAKYPADFSVTPEQARRWRLQQIADCCKEQNLPAALFHQNWLLAEAVQEAATKK